MQHVKTLQRALLLTARRLCSTRSAFVAQDGSDPACDQPEPQRRGRPRRIVGSSSANIRTMRS
jgi:hypothetical protein